MHVLNKPSSRRTLFLPGPKTDCHPRFNNSFPHASALLRELSTSFQAERKIRNRRATFMYSIASVAIGTMRQDVILASLSGLALLLVVWLLQKHRRRSYYKLPPQVPGVPIFGNALQIPALQQGPWAKKLAEQYGEMLVPDVCLVCRC